MAIFKHRGKLGCAAICCIVGSLASHCTAVEDYARLREQLVSEEIAAAGISNQAVLRAMRETPRHEFVPTEMQQFAYLDAALPIGDRQTISPPFVVAYMTEQLDPQPQDRVLEIGTGSGYQAAVLSLLVEEVYTIEIVERLGRRAEHALQRLDYDNVQVRIGDGYQGWPEAAPFDKIIVTCSPEDIPQPLVEQLKDGGQMIIPIGERYQQNLYRVTKRGEQLEKQPLQATLFVPMTGTAEDERDVLPDPSQPSVVNGGFEEAIDKQQLPAGWHYLRQVRTVAASDAPGGQRYLSCTNEQPGRASRALQGMALDGREVSRLTLSAMVRGKALQAGLTPQEQPAIVLTFYDANRAVVGSRWIGPWRGSFDWRRQSTEIQVPLATREVILRLGLLGGVGTLDIDEVAVTRASEAAPGREP